MPKLKVTITTMNGDVLDLLQIEPFERRQSSAAGPDENELSNQIVRVLENQFEVEPLDWPVTPKNMRG